MWRISISTQYSDELAKCSNEPVEKTVDRINHHYVDSSRIIKRAFGETLDNDFQKYNWGISVMSELGFEGDKLDFLISLYCRTIPKRIVENDFKIIILFHTSFKYVENRYEKKERWLDLKISWRVQKCRKTGYPDSITRRSMRSIMKVNELNFDIDIVKITKDMRKYDRRARKLHMILLDDPLIGKFNRRKDSMEASRRSSDYFDEEFDSFEDLIKQEEEQYGIVRLIEIERRLKAELDKEEAAMKSRIQHHHHNEGNYVSEEGKTMESSEDVRREGSQRRDGTDHECKEEEMEEHIGMIDTESTGLINKSCENDITTRDRIVPIRIFDGNASLVSVHQETNSQTVHEHTETSFFSDIGGTNAFQKLVDHMKERELLKRAEKTTLVKLVSSKMSSIVEKNTKTKSMKNVGATILSPKSSYKSERELQSGLNVAKRMKKIHENRLFRLKVESSRTQQDETEQKVLAIATNVKIKRKQKLQV